MVTLYSKPNCPSCVSTKDVLNSLEISYTEIDMTKDKSALQKVMGLGFKSAPVVVPEEGTPWAGFKRDRLESLVSLDDMDSVFA